MRKSESLLAALFLSTLFCASCSLFGGDDEDDLKMRGHVLKARIMGDWQWRDVRPQDGREIDELLTKRDGKWLCKKDDTEVEEVIILSEEKDRPDRREERAYYCAKEKVYWYHLIGGPKKRNTLLGPFQLEY